jgi:hypothetical protein
MRGQRQPTVEVFRQLLRDLFSSRFATAAAKKKARQAPPRHADR